jgi:RsiW-degrading membrane proteinase PrsW (M82 family)
MSMAFLVAVVFAFVPAFLMAVFIYWLDRYEKEPLILLGAAFFWGAVIAAGGAFIINTVFGIGIYALTGSGDIADQTTASVVAPFVEEGLKGLAVLIVFLAFRAEFDSVLDGIIYAGITALGFAATENVLYIYEHGFLEGGWDGLWKLVFIRDLVVAWQHPFFTAFTGIGLAVARLNKNVLAKLIAAPMGYASAVFAHAFHNSFADLIGGMEGFAAGTVLDWFGWFVMAVFILFMIGRERGLLKRQLRDEVTSGVISSAQYIRALSPFTMSTAFLTGGAAASRFYRACGELAHKKEQLLNLGDEGGNTARVQSLRAELTKLAPQVRA